MIKWIKKLLNKKEILIKRMTNEEYNKLHFEKEKKLNVILDKLVNGKILSKEEQDFLRKYNK